MLEIAIQTTIQRETGSPGKACISSAELLEGNFSDLQSVPEQGCVKSLWVSHSISFLTTAIVLVFFRSSCVLHQDMWTVSKEVPMRWSHLGTIFKALLQVEVRLLRGWRVAEHIPFSYEPCTSFIYLRELQLIAHSKKKVPLRFRDDRKAENIENPLSKQQIMFSCRCMCRISSKELLCLDCWINSPACLCRTSSAFWSCWWPVCFPPVQPTAIQSVVRRGGHVSRVYALPHKQQLKYGDECG